MWAANETPANHLEKVDGSFEISQFITDSKCHWSAFAFSFRFDYQ